MRWARALAAGAAVVGGALIAVAVATAQASVALVVVVPVLYGRSPLLVGGVGLVLLGLIGWVLTSDAPDPGAPLSEEPEGPPAGGVRSGGLILLGPIPIVWGSGVTISRRGRWLLTAGGAVLFLLALVIVLTVR